MLSTSEIYSKCVLLYQSMYVQAENCDWQLLWQRMFTYFLLPPTTCRFNYQLKMNRVLKANHMPLCNSSHLQRVVYMRNRSAGKHKQVALFDSALTRVDAGAYVCAYYSAFVRTYYSADTGV